MRRKELPEQVLCENELVLSMQDLKEGMSEIFLEQHALSHELRIPVALPFYFR